MWPNIFARYTCLFFVFHTRVFIFSATFQYDHYHPHELLFSNPNTGWCDFIFLCLESWLGTISLFKSFWDSSWIKNNVPWQVIGKGFRQKMFSLIRYTLPSRISQGESISKSHFHPNYFSKKNLKNNRKISELLIKDSTKQKLLVQSQPTMLNTREKEHGVNALELVGSGEHLWTLFVDLGYSSIIYTHIQSPTRIFIAHIE